MRLSRRDFLGALAAAPLGRAFTTPTRSAPARATTCALPESRAGFAAALAGRETAGVVVYAGAAGWDDSIERSVSSGRLVIFESAAGFAEAGAFEEQRAGLRRFGLTLGDPVALWREGRRPSYLDLLWPARARVRDFSFAVPVRGGQTIGTLGDHPVAARQPVGPGALLFLGSPVGPALGLGDADSHAWLDAVMRWRGCPGTAGRCAGCRTRARCGRARW